MSKGIQCDECGFLFRDHSNHFGKICTRCGNYIKPDHSVVEKNEEKYKQAQDSLRAYLKQFMEDKRNANQEG